MPAIQLATTGPIQLLSSTPPLPALSLYQKMILKVAGVPGAMSATIIRIGPEIPAVLLPEAQVRTMTTHQAGLYYQTVHGTKGSRQGQRSHDAGQLR